MNEMNMQTLYFYYLFSWIFSMWSEMSFDKSLQLEQEINQSN